MHVLPDIKINKKKEGGQNFLEITNQNKIQYQLRGKIYDDDVVKDADE